MGISGVPANLKPADLQLVRALADRDRAVRQHEQAHLNAAAGLAMSGASYSYSRGPDGKLYATGGEVRIDASSGGTPEETLRRARTLQAAALAPANPSGADMAIAARASQMAVQALAQLAQEMQQQRAEQMAARSSSVEGESATLAFANRRGATMAVQSVSSPSTAVQQTQQRPAVQQTPAPSETAENQERAASQANEANQARKTEEAPKPVLNLQGQSIGGTVNTTA